MEISLLVLIRTCYNYNGRLHKSDHNMIRLFFSILIIGFIFLLNVYSFDMLKPAGAVDSHTDEQLSSIFNGSERKRLFYQQDNNTQRSLILMGRPRLGKPIIDQEDFIKAFDHCYADDFIQLGKEYVLQGANVLDIAKASLFDSLSSLGHVLVPKKELLEKESIVRDVFNSVFGVVCFDGHNKPFIFVAPDIVRQAHPEFYPTIVFETVAAYYLMNGYSKQHAHDSAEIVEVNFRVREFGQKLFNYIRQHNPDITNLLEYFNMNKTNYFRKELLTIVESYVFKFNSYSLNLSLEADDEIRFLFAIEHMLKHLRERREDEKSKRILQYYTKALTKFDINDLNFSPMDREISMMILRFIEPFVQQKYKIRRENKKDTSILEGIKTGSAAEILNMLKSDDTSAIGEPFKLSGVLTLKDVFNFEHDITDNDDIENEVCFDKSGQQWILMKLAGWGIMDRLSFPDVSIHMHTHPKQNPFPSLTDIIGSVSRHYRRRYYLMASREGISLYSGDVEGIIYYMPWSELDMDMTVEQFINSYCKKKITDGKLQKFIDSAL